MLKVQELFFLTTDTGATLPLYKNRDSQFKMKTQLDTTYQCWVLLDLCPRHTGHQKHTKGEFHPKSNSETGPFWAQLELNFACSSAWQYVIYLAHRSKLAQAHLSLPWISQSKYNGTKPFCSTNVLFCLLGKVVNSLRAWHFSYVPWSSLHRANKRKGSF